MRICFSCFFSFNICFETTCMFAINAIPYELKPSLRHRNYNVIARFVACARLFSVVFVPFSIFQRTKFTNIFNLSFHLVRDWLSLVPPTAVVAGIGYMSYLSFCPEARKCAKVTRVNKSIRLEDAKVADFVDIEDIAEKAAFCRCWNSKNVRNIIKKPKYSNKHAPHRT